MFKSISWIFAAMAALVLMLATGGAYAQEVAEEVADPALWNLLTGALPGWAMIALLAAVGVINVLGKAIPDNATGWLKWVRKVSKFVTMYVPNQK